MSVLNECSKDDAEVYEIIWSGYLDSNEYLKSYGGREIMDMKEAFCSGILCGIGLMVAEQKMKDAE